MSELALHGVFAHGLGPLEARFETGLNVVLGSALTDLSTLAELLAGATGPRVGRISLDGHAIDGRPARGYELASLLDREELFDAENVGDAIEQMCSLRGSSLSSELMLREARISAFASRKPRNLDAWERRAVALCLALALEPLKLLTLFDPFALSPDIDPRFITERCRARAERAIVVVLVPSVTDAMRLGGKVFWLERGRLEGPKTEGQPNATLPGLVVRSEAAATLAERLASEPEVGRVDYDAARAPHDLVVRGADLEALALSLLRAVERAGAHVESISTEMPALDSVLLARAGWTDAAYHPRPGTRA
jgi:ABC-type thiamine transport system ATPase subunit